MLKRKGYIYSDINQVDEREVFQKSEIFEAIGQKEGKEGVIFKKKIFNIFQRALSK